MATQLEPPIATRTNDMVDATIRYVSREGQRPSHEKPYILHFDAPEGIPQNNFSIQPFSGLKVRNLRSAGLRYQDHGIAVTPVDATGFRPEDFDDDDWIERVYLPRLHKSICDALGAKDMTVFDWMVRKRAASFPERSPGETNGEAVQPSLSAHVGKQTSSST